MDSWSTLTKEQLNEFILAVGRPLWTINLKAEGTQLQLAYRRKKEMEPDAELGEEDVANIAEQEKAC